MKQLKIQKVLALPETLDTDTLYLLKNSEGDLELYTSFTSSAQTIKIPNKVEIINEVAIVSDTEPALPNTSPIWVNKTTGTLCVQQNVEGVDAWVPITAEGVVSFGNIQNLPTTRDGFGITDVPKSDGTDATGTWNISIHGNADTASMASEADTLVTPRAINGTSFDGSADITTGFWGMARNLTIGSMAKSVNGSQNVSWTLTEIGAPALNGTGATGTWSISVTGNAATATKLATARTVTLTGDVSGSASFDGSANITITTTVADNSHAHAITDITNLSTTLAAKADLVGGVIPANQLPSYVDDVLEYAALASFPATGETGKIYVAIDTNKIYRWSGTVYIEISPVAGNADTATKLATARAITITGDASWTVNFDGSVAVSSAITLANTGVTAGTYRSVTTDSKGRITAGTNPTTLLGYGITDATPSSHIGATGTAHGAATTSVNGFMSSADKTKLDGIATGATANTGTVTSVGLSLPSVFTVSNSPVTTSGTLTVALASQTAAYVFAAPTGANGVPSFRALVAGDIPNLDWAKITTGKPTTRDGYGITDVPKSDGTSASGTWGIAITGNAATATKLATARTINGTSFDGTADITTTNWGTARTITIGSTGKSINGSANITWTAAEMGVLPLTGGTLTGALSGTTAAFSGVVTGTSFNSITGLSSTTPVVNGTAAVGTGTTAARGDHVHPTDTTRAAIGQTMYIGTTAFTINRASAAIALTGITSIDGSASKLTTARTIALSTGVTGTATLFDGSTNITIPVTALNADYLSSGTIPDARLTGTYSGFTHKIDGTNSIFTTPNTGSTSVNGRTVFGLAEYKNDSSAATGAIVFIAPTTASTIMHQMYISCMLYNTSIVDMIIQGYRTTGAWSSTRKISTGTADVQVRWGVTSDGKNCLILGDVGTVWSYPHVMINRALFSHTGVVDAYCSGWTVGLVTDLSTYTNVSATITDTAMTGSITGNAATATTLQTARTIGGVSFDGSANINLPGVNTTGNQNTTGSAATLTTARTINGVSFNGSANISVNTNYTVTFNNSGTGGASGITFNGSAAQTVSYNTVGAPSTTGANASGTWGINITGSAATASSATVLVSQGNYDATAPGTTRGPAGLNLFNVYNNGYPVTYGTLLHICGGGAGQILVGWSGVDGSHADNFIRSKRDNDSGAWSGWAKLLTDQNYSSYSPTLTGGGASGTWGISISGNAATATSATSATSATTAGSCTGNAATATKLATARTIGGVSFDGTANINLPGVNAAGNQNTTGSAATLTTARTLTIGSTGKTFNGSANVSWSLAEMGAAPTASPTFTGVTSMVAANGTHVALASGAIDLTAGSSFSYTLTASTTFTLSNVPASGKMICFILELTNAGAYTTTLWSNIKWAGGTVPTLSASGRDVLGFYTRDGGTTWTGTVIAKDAK